MMFSGPGMDGGGPMAIMPPPGAMPPMAQAMAPGLQNMMNAQLPPPGLHTNLSSMGNPGPGAGQVNLGGMGMPGQQPGAPF